MFSQLEALYRRKQTREAYRRKFAALNDEDARLVIADLARFCHAYRTSAKVGALSGAIDPLAMALAEGRREVFIRIARYAGMNDADLDAAIARLEQE